MYIIGQHFAAESTQMPYHGAADLTCPHHPHGAMADILSHFSLQAVILYQRTVHDMGHIAAAHEHQHDGVIRHSLRLIADMTYAHAQFFRLFQIYMVKPDGTGGHIPHAHIMKTLQHIGPHVTGGTTDGVKSPGQGHIIRGRVLCAVAILGLKRSCQPVKHGFFVKFPQTVCKYFHRHSLFLLSGLPGRKSMLPTVPWN